MTVLRSFRFSPLFSMHEQFFRFVVLVLKVLSSVQHLLIAYRSVAEVFHKKNLTVAATSSNY